MSFCLSTCHHGLKTAPDGAFFNIRKKSSIALEDIVSTKLQRGMAVSKPPRTTGLARIRVDRPLPRVMLDHAPTPHFIPMRKALRVAPAAQRESSRTTRC